MKKAFYFHSFHFRLRYFFALSFLISFISLSLHPELSESWCRILGSVEKELEKVVKEVKFELS